MVIKEHPVETFDDDIRHHAAHSIMEVVDAHVKTNIEKFCGYTKEGFYYIDESECYVTGPFPTFDQAVWERDKYFEGLNNEV